MLRYVTCIAILSGAIVRHGGVHCYAPLLPPSGTRKGYRRPWRPSMLELRRVVRSWQRMPPTTTTRSSSRLFSGSFYDDFEDFSDFGSSDSGDDEGKDKGIGGEGSEPESAAGGNGNAVGGNDDAVMKELRKRMNDLSNQKDDDDEEEEEEFDDADSGSALPDLEGSTISSVDDLIGFAQAKAREKPKDSRGSDKFGGGGTWEDENWARPVPIVDDETGETLDFDDILEGGVVLVANPAKFCSDLADGDDDNDRKPKGKGNSFLGGLFDDPFPTSQSPKSTNGISLALLAKFGITLPPSPDLGPDRRADLLPVVLLIDRDQTKGSRAVLMNRRTGNLMGDLPPSIFESAGDDDAGDNGNGFSPHPLAAFMIQPLWWAGSSPGGSTATEDEDGPSNGRGGGGLRAIDMVHACPYVNNSVPLAKSDGLYWGGSPVQAQEAMKDGRLERPLSGFDFKFFIQTTRWLPSQLEQEIKDGTWYLATVSKEVLFRSRDRLGSKRAKPLWTEIIELLGDDYKHIKDKLYGEEE